MPAPWSIPDLLEGALKPETVDSNGLSLEETNCPHPGGSFRLGKKVVRLHSGGPLPFTGR